MTTCRRESSLKPILTFPSDLTFLSAKGTTFVPILRSKLQLRKDLTAAGYQQSSYTDAFFMTLVHEFGHTLGLQHTFTSATMSTAITRATTRGVPLATDDVSGISLLYPAGGYAASTGSITGQVIAAASGAGINLASVVALSTSGVAVSGMTRPDGTYEIDGIPPGQYYIYVHPLPPPQTGEATPANIVTPADPQKDSFAANTSFVTQFFPGTQDWTQAAPVTAWRPAKRREECQLRSDGERRTRGLRHGNLRLSAGRGNSLAAVCPEDP